MARRIKGPVRYLHYDFGEGIHVYFKEQLVSAYGWAKSDPPDIWWTTTPIRRATYERARREGYPCREVVIGYLVGEPPREVRESGSWPPQRPRRSWRWTPETGWQRLDKEEAG